MRNKIQILFLGLLLLCGIKGNAQALLEFAIVPEWFDTIKGNQRYAWYSFIDSVKYITIPTTSTQQLKVRYLNYRKSNTYSYENDYENDYEPRKRKPLLIVSDSIKLLKNLQYVELRGEIAAKASIEKLLGLPITHLSLKTIDIDTIATPGMELNKIKWLSLDDCYLHAVPIGISQFKGLEVLVLGYIGGHFDKGNEIHSLSDEILQLSKLKKLYLDANLFKSLPVSVLSLHNLTVLSIANNQIKVIPPEIKQLSKLEVLDLSSNKLTALPNSIQKLKNLKMLRVSGNQLSEFPKWIVNLNNLESLEISGNKIKSAPNNLYKLSKLRYLYVDKGVITTKQLQKLKKRLPLCTVIPN